MDRNVCSFYIVLQKYFLFLVEQFEYFIKNIIFFKNNFTDFFYGLYFEHINETQQYSDIILRSVKSRVYMYDFRYLYFKKKQKFTIAKKVIGKQFFCFFSRNFWRVIILQTQLSKLSLATISPIVFSCYFLVISLDKQ